MDIFPDFGKYSFYVWTCYDVSIATLVALTLHTLIQNRKRKK